MEIAIICLDANAKNDAEAHLFTRHVRVVPRIGETIFYKNYFEVIGVTHDFGHVQTPIYVTLRKVERKPKRA